MKKDKPKEPETLKPLIPEIPCFTLTMKGPSL